MPVLQIRGLPQKEPEKIKQALRDTCLAISEVYGCQPSNVWATREDVKDGLYFEGSVAAENQPADSHPPIAQLICFEGKTSEEIEKTLLVASKTLSEGLGIPNNIFMTYHEARNGQVVSGNGIIRKR